MRLVNPARLLPLFLLLGLGCSGDSTGPSTGSLAVTIQGLPGGSSAAVSVTGPGGYAQSVSSTQTLSQLTPGTYTISASAVTAGSATYNATPTSQTVGVVKGTPARATVTYSTTTGTLAVTINGMGTKKTAAVTVTGPGSFNQTLTGTTTLTGLIPGDYAIDAQNVTASCGGTSYTASPASQSAAVAANTTTNATVTYSAPSGGAVNLCIDGMYLTQSAQNYSASIPLVQGRNGFIRVFVVADQANTPAATVQVQLRFYNPTNVLQSTATISAPAGLLSVPTAPDESSLNKSWNYSVAGSVIQPGLRIEAEVLPGTVVETNPGDNVFQPPVASVRIVPQIDLTFVPILQKGVPPNRRLAGGVTDANKDEFLASTQSMHPITSYNALVHAPYTTTTTDTLQDDNGNNAWSTILGEIDLLRTAESSARYYYGVAKVGYSAGVAGVAYVSTGQIAARASMGWDYLPTGSIVMAHELGHNWARNHAPCGGPTGLDPSYPYSDGTTGGYGYDMSTGQLEPPSSTDIMGYCNLKWISEYTYLGVLNYLSPAGPFVQGAPVSQAVQPTLLVWGHIRDGELVLEPAFQVDARPRLPSRPGPYSIEGKAADGSSLFGLSFSPNQIADGRGTQQNFVFAVPMSATRASRLASLELNGRGKKAVLAAAAVSGTSAAQPDVIETLRESRGQVRLRWDARVHPMVMVRDPETGQVLMLARGGEVKFSTLKNRVELLLSDGLKSRVKRMSVR